MGNEDSSHVDRAARLWREFQIENDDLKARLQVLTTAAAQNEAILRKTQERELDLLQADTIPALLDVLLRDFAKSFSLDAIALILRDPQHDIRHLLLGGGHRLEDLPGVMLMDTLTGVAPPLGFDCRPWLGPYSAGEHRALFRDGGQAQLGSVAIIPLRRQQRLTGLLVFGSTDRQRFTRHHATDFLAHLGVIAAVCMENAVNRAQLLHSGMTDFLTGWHNRRYLQTRLREELARAQRRSSSVACMMIDVDHFKEANDTLGHLGGDEVLRELARRIEGHIRASDTAARFGGDEFAILLPDTELTPAVLLAERIRQTSCAQPIDLGRSRSHRMSLSIGVAAMQPQRGSRDLNALADDLLADADAALYRAKGGGRGRVEQHGLKGRLVHESLPADQDQEQRHADESRQGADGQLTGRNQRARQKVRKD